MSNGGAVVAKIVTFGRILREVGVEVGPGRLQSALIALDQVDLRRRDEVYAALACTLVARKDDLELFDRAFRAWFEQAPLEDIGQRPVDLGISVEPDEKPQALPAHGMEDEDDDAEEIEDVVAAWSATEVLRDRDFADLTRDELLAIRAAMADIARKLPKRRSRRLERSAHGDRIDPRETLRRAMRYEGEPIDRAFREQKLVQRRAVFLCDVSGSMEPYARALVLFLQAAVSVGQRFEAFTFGTRLTRLTPYLDGHDPEAALKRAAAAVPDWAGGTRIGEAIHAFNEVYGRRGLTRGALVVIASDGWERGDTSLLGHEMARLRRRSHAVVWINPLKGTEGYEPLAAGMAAALPHCDLFLPGHNLAALQGMTAALAAFDRHGRAGRVRTVPASHGAKR